MVNFTILLLHSLPRMSQKISDLRKEYTMKGLSEQEVARQPLDQFREWFEAALDSGVPEPNAMHLSTVDEHHRPSSRIVLIKDLEANGIVFYTNYHGRKGRDLAVNPFASLTFFWPELERQVRIEGVVEKTSAGVSDAYFASRPRGSQIGAWVSHQSEYLPSREILDEKQAAYEARFADGPVPRPPHWGGYRLTPDRVEFWQGRPSRLHDRVVYTLDEATGQWSIGRLSP